MGLKIGDVSPVAALLGAKGAIRDVASTGALGLIPKMMTKDDKKKEAEKMSAKKPGMSKGGKTGYKAGASVKARGEGCCTRSKKCKMY